MTIPGPIRLPRPWEEASLVRLAAERLAQAGLDPDPLLRQAGPSQESLPCSGADAQTAFLNAAAEALNDASFGLRLAQDYDLRRLGLLFYLMMSAETLGEALACLERFGSADDARFDGSYRVSDIAVTVALDHDAPGRDPVRHLSEFWLLTISRLVALLTGAAAVPLRVSLRCPRRDADEVTESYFPCGVAFDASEDRIDFESDLADAKLATCDPHLHAYLLQHFEQLAAGARWEPAVLWSRVKKAMVPRLPHGTVTTTNIAHDLGLSTRTLSRRLRHEGRTFSAILDELRAELALHYIGIRKLPISEIAWHLGYREASALVVAFRRWTGMSPSQLRRAHVAGSGSFPPRPTRTASDDRPEDGRS